MWSCRRSLKLEEKKKVEDNVEIFLSYIDDDGTIKNKWVLLVSEDEHFLTFRFKDGLDEISIPFSKINKIKRKIK